MTDVKEYRRRADELEREVAQLKAWRKQLLDEGFGYDDSEESAAEVLEWAPIWRAQESGIEHALSGVKEWMDRYHYISLPGAWEELEAITGHPARAIAAGRT